MKTISKEFRAKLDDKFEIYDTEISLSQHSQDGTIKVGFKTFDNETVEGVVPANLIWSFINTGLANGQRFKPMTIFSTQFWVISI